MGLASGLVPVSDLSSNSTSPVPFDYCVVPGTHDYAGQLVSAWHATQITFNICRQDGGYAWQHLTGCLGDDTAPA